MSENQIKPNKVKEYLDSINISAILLSLLSGVIGAILVNTFIHVVDNGKHKPLATVDLKALVKICNTKAFNTLTNGTESAIATKNALDFASKCDDYTNQVLDYIAKSNNIDLIQKAAIANSNTNLPDFTNEASEYLKQFNNK